MNRYENNHCDVCGAPIGDNFQYCREHSRDTCKCGKSKYRDEDMCQNCQIENEKLIYGFGICPICEMEFKFSSYLHTAIQNEKTRLIANLITHYRHEHQKSWESQYKYISIMYDENVYEKAKSEHNNRAKRQILRKCKPWITENGIAQYNFMELQDNDEKTIELIKKTFQHD